MNLLTDLSFNRISSDDELRPFDCGDNDLNDFFFDDVVNYSQELLTVTYTFETREPAEVIVFYSVLNDKISDDQAHSGKLPRGVYRRIPNEKRRKSYPAVKVARLGVNSKYQGAGVGAYVLNFIKYSFTHGNKTGCRFITVDAYNKEKVISFYQQNGFKFLIETVEDEKEDARLMYYDLINFQPAPETAK